ncbi:glycosyltransferase [Clostridium zeae]|nr:glycosyltransferase [Clostridium zeae]
MKILHYTLGLPPYRTGGLTKYSIDIMSEQSKEGNDVFLLFPGIIEVLNKKTSIKPYKRYGNIRVFEIVNPLPVPLLNGVRKPEIFMKSCDKKIFIEFLIDLKIEVVHIHTFMGLYKEFILACKELGIKVLYTTHDYFGLCTKVNFFDYEGNSCEERNIEKCLKCNMCGSSEGKMLILQSKPYRELKNIGFIDLIKKMKVKSKSNDKEVDDVVSDINEECYIELIKYYEEMYVNIDFFLFNSSVTKNIFMKYLNIKGEIVPITHSNIKDNKVLKNYEDKTLKITYLGPTKKYKGFNFIIDVMKRIETSDIQLNVYGDTTVDKTVVPNNTHLHGRYRYEQLKEIFINTDVLVVPSIWNETFGFITLEALSYGVPVISSDMVGSKDMLDYERYGLVLKPEIQLFADKLIELQKDKSKLKDFNTNIVSSLNVLNIKEHVKDLYYYYEDGR